VTIGNLDIPTKKPNYTSNKRNFNSDQGNNTFNYRNKKLKMSERSTLSIIAKNDSSANLIFNSRKSDCLSWELAKPKIIEAFDINKCWDVVNYHDSLITDEDGNAEIAEEELKPRPKLKNGSMLKFHVWMMRKISISSIDKNL
jgi:hypothetical protein